MTKEELLEALRSTELDLRSTEMILFVKAQPLNFRTNFAADLATLSASIESIENAELADISSRLNALGPDLQDGIKGLGASIASVEKTVAIFQEIGAVVGLAVKVAGLAP